MSVMEIVVGAFLILLTVALTGLVLMQEGKGGMGALTGAEQPESFGRNAGKTLSSTLKTATKIATGVLMVLVVLLNVMVVYF